MPDQREPNGGTGGPSRDNGAFTAPTLTLPKGGGAIRGIGEKFAANPVTGTGSMSLPIVTSPGRAGFGPELSLSYDSGAGNGTFGFGWSLNLPQITRKTDKGLPQYNDAGGSDVFLLSGAEDLVPVYLQDAAGQWVRDPQDNLVIHEDGRDGYTVRRYRPRIEGMFARIERWAAVSDPRDVHWRSISRDNILTIYGKDKNSRIADPADLKRIFGWLICETRDDKGNAVLYEYKPEDGAGVDLTHAHERSRGDRGDSRREANRYLKHIRYGNRVPLLDVTGKRPRVLTAEQIEGAGWMFQVVFDYGEHDAETPQPDDRGRWSFRNDPFSTYRAGFEVRTTRLCQRVLMFHHFPGEPEVGNDCLVRSADFTYSHEQDPASARNPVYTFLRAVTQTGYRRHGGGYLKRSLPPVEFGYSQPIVQDTVQAVDAESLENLPVGLDGASYQWTDLHGEGIPGILTEQGGAWLYKRNFSPINVEPADGIARTKAKFAPVELVAVRPNLALAGGEARFMDLAGDGQPDLVVLDGPAPGLYEHDGEEGWWPFRPFTSRLNRDTRDPNVRFVDLDGDGHADVLISEDGAFVWHPSLAEEGFGPARRVHQALDEEKGPRLVLADGTQSIYLADMCGDGLTDLVRIRNGEVCYWPNLGYGRFGAKITMDHAPNFDNPDQFDQKRIRLADIDGTGTTDIIYLHRDGVRLYFNQSGNSWSEAQELPVFPRVDDLAAIIPTDLLGNGTACLVWSSALPGDAGQQMRYVDLMGGQKPHLLVSVKNNLGAETHVHYAPSTKFYLGDKVAGEPWVTRLPFPVHVVERVVTRDRISRNRFVTRYAYHHGYFDGEEREFRGFGMVEQWDTEKFAALDGSAPLATSGGEGEGEEAINRSAAFNVPPVHTKTWFHTGRYLDREHISRQFESEYWRQPGLTEEKFRALLLPDTTLPAGLTLEEEREACRALKGMILRQEVYADDAPRGASEAMIQRARTPYTVVEQDFTIRTLQPRAGNRHAVFFAHPREAITFHYERNPADPRIQHALTLEVDDFGNVLKEAAIGYGRRQRDATLPLQADRDKQARTLITYIENRFTKTYTDNGDTKAIDDSAIHPDDYRTPLPFEACTYELTGLKPKDNALRFGFDEWSRDGFALPTLAAEIPYEQAADNTTRQRRLIEHVRTVYRDDDLGALLPLGEVKPLALPGESYKLALTPGLLARVFKRKRTGHPDEDLLPDPAGLLEGKGPDQGGYVACDGGWWIPSGRIYFDPGTDVADPARTAAQELSAARQHFYLPRKFTDPFGHSTVVDYAHDLLITRTSDALGNTVAAANDYRVLQPRLITDPNGNRTAAAFDALGMVVATAVMGKEGENLGDLLEGFDADPPLTVLQAFVADSRTRAASLLGKATTRIVYDLERYGRCGQPPFAATLARETHFHDPGGDQTKIQVSFSYSDGFGREIQKKIQAERGEAPQRQAPVSLPAGDIRPGELVRDAQGKPVPADTPHRWVGSGRTVYNNKGKPVRQYEPFFSATHLYEPEREMTDTGVSSVLFYDPVERVIATLHPNHTYEKVVFDPWQQTTYDVNDTVAARGEQTGDPRTDPDIAGYVREYIKTQPDAWQTWYAQRQGGALGPHEQAAAAKAADHADTPTTAHLDTLGRPFLTVARNRVVCPNHSLDGREDEFHTRVELDIEGNQRAVTDAKDRVVMRYDYDMLGNRIHQASMEAGERWTLNDVAGNAIRAWDSRRFIRRVTYDALRRPIGLYVTENGAERLAERTVYGEGHPDSDVNAPQQLNVRGRVFQVLDGAGLVTNVDRNPDTDRDEGYDFKGNLLRSTRRLARNYKDPIASSALDPLLTAAPLDLLAIEAALGPMLQAETESFRQSTTYDALNRPLTVTTPDNSVYRPTFNEANLLDKVDVNLRGAPTATPFVTNIDYNAKGQRLLIEDGSGAAPSRQGVTTTYDYDPLTFRLRHLKTTRPAGPNGLAVQIFADPKVVQDLRYAYDPVGNVTRIEDAALKTVFHDGQQVEPAGTYTYDAIYRLIEAEGREHIGQTAFDFEPPNGDYRDYPFVGHRHPNDLQALRNYTEYYEYDAVGNFQALRHLANGGHWTRRYDYEEESLLEAGKQSNRLTRITVGDGLGDTEGYAYTDDQGNDVHGCMTAIKGRMMRWDFKDQLQQVDLGGGGTAYYVYDAAGQRVRKVIESQNGAPRKERIYLGGFEIYREYNGSGATVTLERESLHLMDDQQRIALVETQTAENGSRINTPVPLQRYQLGNHLGSASVELADHGALISYEEYHPYGTTAFQARRSAAEMSLNRYRYTGKERDDENGFYYYGFRYYIPWLGRWLTCDAAIVDDLNLYTYTRGNPSKFLDTDGRRAATPDEAATLSRLEQVEQNARNQYNKLPFISKVWEVSFGSSSGPRREAGIAGWNKRAYAAAIDRAREGEAVTIVPGPAEGTWAVLTRREVYMQRQSEVGVAIAFSPLSAAGYVGAELAGASIEVRESLALGGAPAWEGVLALGGLVSHRLANQSVRHGDPLEAQTIVIGDPPKAPRLVIDPLVYRRGVLSGAGRKMEGDLREAIVAEISGGEVAKNIKGQDIPLKVSIIPGKPLQLDVIGPNLEFILVGGPNKGENMPKTIEGLTQLKRYAEFFGVRGMAYFETGTSKEVLHHAELILGKENVKIFRTIPTARGRFMLEE